MVVVVKKVEQNTSQQLIKQDFGILSDDEDDGDTSVVTQQKVVKEVVKKVSYTDKLKQKIKEQDEELKDIEKEIHSVECGEKDKHLIMDMRNRQKQENDRLTKDAHRKEMIAKEKKETQLFQEKVRQQES